MRLFLFNFSINISAQLHYCLYTRAYSRLNGKREAFCKRLHSLAHLLFRVVAHLAVPGAWHNEHVPFLYAVSSKYTGCLVVIKKERREKKNKSKELLEFSLSLSLSLTRSILVFEIFLPLGNFNLSRN